MAPKRILLCDIQAPFVRGGAEALWENLYGQLIAAGFAVERIFIPFRWFPKIDLLNNAVLWRSLSIADTADLAITTRFPSYCVQFENKVVWLQHQHRPVYELFGDPNYSDFRSGDPVDEQIRDSIHRIDSKFLSQCRARFATSKHVAARLKKNSGLDAEILYPPAPLQNIHFEAMEDFLFLPTRLEANKRPEILLEAMEFVRSPLKCVIAGSGGLEPILRERVRTWRLQQRVKLIGKVSDDEIRNLYARCLAVVYPPKDEDLGFVTMEAFLAGKPVITMADSGGPLEFVDPGQSGFVVQDAREIADKLDYLYAHKEIAREMGRCGQQRMEKMKIQWSHVVERLTQFA